MGYLEIFLHFIYFLILFRHEWHFSFSHALKIKNILHFFGKIFFFFSLQLFISVHYVYLVKRLHRVQHEMVLLHVTILNLGWLEQGTLHSILFLVSLMQLCCYGVACCWKPRWSGNTCILSSSFLLSSLHSSTFHFPFFPLSFFFQMDSFQPVDPQTFFLNVMPSYACLLSHIWSMPSLLPLSLIILVYILTLYVFYL